MATREKRVLRLESQDDIAYITGKRDPEEEKKQIKTPRLRCPECGRFISYKATYCKSCGAEL